MRGEAVAQGVRTDALADAAQPQAGEKAAVHGRTEGADPEQAEIEQREFSQHGADAIAREHRGRDREKDDDLLSRKGVVAEDLEYVRQEGYAATEQDQPQHV